MLTDKRLDLNFTTNTLCDLMACNENYYSVHGAYIAQIETGWKLDKKDSFSHPFFSPGMLSVEKDKIKIRYSHNQPERNKSNSETLSFSLIGSCPLKEFIIQKYQNNYYYRGNPLEDVIDSDIAMIIGNCIQSLTYTHDILMFFYELFCFHEETKLLSQIIDKYSDKGFSNFVWQGALYRFSKADELLVCLIQKNLWKPDIYQSHNLALSQSDMLLNQIGRDFMSIDNMSDEPFKWNGLWEMKCEQLKFVLDKQSFLIKLQKNLPQHVNRKEDKKIKL